MKTPKILALGALSITLNLVPSLVHAETDAAAWLLGDWHGQRSALAERGIALEMVATVDVLGTLDGGLRRGVDAPFNFDLALEVDTTKAGWWSNGRLRIYFLGNAGGNTNGRVGALQVASNIEAPGTFKLYEAYYEHRWFDDRISMLVGLHDLNSEFYVTELSGVLLNSSFGIGQEMAQVGPSIFPSTAPAARVRIQPTAQTYVMGAVYDGVPGDPDNPYGTQVAFDRGDGVLAIGEAGITSKAGRYFKVGFGGWHQTEFDNMVTGRHGDNHGYYALAEVDLWRGEDGRGLGLFGQLGFAESDRNQTDLYAGGGLNWTGMFAARPEDIAAVAFGHARNGEDFLRANPGAFRQGETVLEITYQFAPRPWLVIQPDLQYFMNPGSARGVDDALLAGCRVQVVF